VAAAQFFPRMGEVERNRSTMEALAREAARAGAEIVVFPETAVQGYMEPDERQVWRTPEFEGDAKERSLDGVSETVPGPSTRLFSRLASELSVYLLLPLIERDAESGKHYNTAVLLGPGGETVLHYRKAAPWTVAEYAWASRGDGTPAVADTPLGRIGVMICYDVHTMLGKLSRAGAELVLWPLWWVDHDPDLWFGERLGELCRRHHVAVAGANRSATGLAGELPGAGYSCVVGKDGRILSIAQNPGTGVVVTDVPLFRGGRQGK
jgi:predicted amidohydrolase